MCFYRYITYTNIDLDWINLITQIFANLLMFWLFSIIFFMAINEISIWKKYIPIINTDYQILFPFPAGSEDAIFWDKLATNGTKIFKSTIKVGPPVAKFCFALTCGVIWGVDPVAEYYGYKQPGRLFAIKTKPYLDKIVTQFFHEKK